MAATRTKKNDDPGKAPRCYARPSSFGVIAWPPIGRCCIRCAMCRTTLRPPPPEVVRLVASACPRSLLLREPGTDSTPLHMVIARGAGIDTMGALLKAPTSIDARRDLLLTLNSRRQTPLLDAARRGADEDVVRYLVDLDVDGLSLLVVGCDTSKRKERRYQHGNNDVPFQYIASRESIFANNNLPHHLLHRSTHQQAL